MFIIATSGRTGTMAICKGLNEYSDHVVEHEPEPRLLYEAYLKHTTQPYQTEAFQERVQFFRSREREKFGMSWRAPNLLDEIRAVAPSTRFLVAARHPLEYVVSAHYMKVFQKNDIWDQTRIVPHHVQLAQHSLAEKIVWHWVAVYEYLLDFAERTQTQVLLLSKNLEADIERWAAVLNIQIVDPQGLRAFLRTRPNATIQREFPSGYNEQRLMHIAGNTWERLQHLAA